MKRLQRIADDIAHTSNRKGPVGWIATLLIAGFTLGVFVLGLICLSLFVQLCVWLGGFISGWLIVALALSVLVLMSLLGKGN